MPHFSYFTGRLQRRNILSVRKRSGLQYTRLRRVFQNCSPSKSAAFRSWIDNFASCLPSLFPLVLHVAHVCVVIPSQGKITVTHCKNEGRPGRWEDVRDKGLRLKNMVPGKFYFFAPTGIERRRAQGRVRYGLTCTETHTEA